MPEFLIPLSLVMIAALVAPRSWLSGTKARPVVIWISLAIVTIVIVRYLRWRVTETLPLHADLSFGEAAFAWGLFVIEMATWCDTAILFLTLTRQRNNSALADVGEEYLRAKPSSALPHVDVFIATYNEDLDVLEKTIVGALALDWPRDRLKIYVLDDGKRPWLADYCMQRGIFHLTRDNNAHAKAGNINAAIIRTEGEFFMVLDADFVPQQNFLFRAMGLFIDPKVGIVQIPHNFYNADPMQTNLGVRKSLPDDQRLFFETIMCGRDGWDNAFCCGSNSITRRTAIETIGNALPTGSVTEDMLLTMALLRNGYVTRYLNERLAVGLAPESLAAMYIQRARWARGAIQILFLRLGPLGPGLTPVQRIMFLPLHWITQPLKILATLLTPTVCLWTGWSPLPSATVQAIVSFQLPALLATLAILSLTAPKSFFPLASTVHAAIHVPRILPTVITTLIKPHGHAFKVTPKGSAAGAAVDNLMVYAPTIVVFVTALGLYLNMNPNTRIVSSFGQIPMLTFWAVASMVVLSIVQAVAISPSGAVRSERFDVDLACIFGTRTGERLSARIENLSMTGAGLRLDNVSQMSQNIQWLYLALPGVGPIAATVVRQTNDTAGVAFDLPTGPKRDALLRLLFTNGMDNSTHAEDGLSLTWQMIARVLRADKQNAYPARDVSMMPPAWLSTECEIEDQNKIMSKTQSLAA